MLCQDAILNFICIDYRPFNTTCQYKSFKHLMKELAPHYKIPSKNTIKKKLDEKYDVAAQIFKQKLNEILHVTISIDTSKEESCKSFLRVRIH